MTRPPPESAAGRRRPRSVYAAGDEPDPRFSFANERTFLAWIRTALTMLAAAAAVVSLDLSMPEPARRFIAVILVGTSLVCTVQAWRGWKRAEQALRHDQALPGNPGKLPVVIGVTLVALTLLVVAVIQ